MRSGLPSFTLHSSEAPDMRLAIGRRSIAPLVKQNSPVPKASCLRPSVQCLPIRDNCSVVYEGMVAHDSPLWNTSSWISR